MSELRLLGRIMPASNATFLAELDGVKVVYKPIQGERPLWDFPDGTLADREYAAWLVDQEFGGSLIPRTWLGEGPFGKGMLQQWQDQLPGETAVDVVAPGSRPEGWHEVFEGLDEDDQAVVLVHEDSRELRQMALLDAVINNSDRKGGHVLCLSDDRRMGVDHGVSFHVTPKLRTVLWGWLDAELTAAELELLGGLERSLQGLLGKTLAPHLTPDEIAALRQRTRELQEAGRMPTPSPHWPAIPWPAF